MIASCPGPHLKRPSRLRPLASISLLAALTGCASTHGGLQTLGSPESGALAVVEVILDADRTRDPSTEAILAKPRMNGDTDENWSPKVTEGFVQRTDSAGPARSCRSLAGLLIFTNLDPGSYYLRSVGYPTTLVEHVENLDVSFAQQEFNLGQDRNSPLAFEVGPSGLVYLGLITVRAHYETHVDGQVVEFRAREKGGSILVGRNRDDELRAWKALLASAPRSPWAPSIRRRIELLSTGQ